MQTPYFLLPFTRIKERTAAGSVLAVHQAQPVGLPEGNKECTGAALGTSAATATLSPVNDRVRHEAKITWGTLPELPLASVSSYSSSE